MGGKNSSVTVGYRYGMGLHFGICHGPVDALCEIKVGDRTAYAAEVTGSTTIYINAPKLFGGDKREGGVQGYADVLGGTPTQGINTYLQEQHGPEARVPAYRGLFALVYKGGLVASNNPYIKPWAFKVRRIIEGWGEYGTEEVTELAADYLPDWVEGSADPRPVGGSVQYKYDAVGFGTWYTDAEQPLEEVETSLGITLDRELLGWHKITDVGSFLEQASTVSPMDAVDPEDWEVLYLHYNEYTALLEGDEYGTLPGAASQNPCGVMTPAGISPGDPPFYWTGRYADNSTVTLNPVPGVWQFSAVVGPGPDYSPALLSGPDYSNNCTAFPENFGYFPNLNGYADHYISVRRVAQAPEIPGQDLPDWPEDPANYTWDQSTGQTYSKQPYVQTMGAYRWLSAYTVESGYVTARPLGPVLEVGDANDTEAFWTSAYNAAVTAGTMQAGLTYNAAGTGDVTTYPRNAAYAYSRTYDAIVPPEPPDPGLAQIGDDMNPAHIVRQCITNPEWGMGYPEGTIGESFTTVAQALYDEEFGLSFQWTQQQPVEEFIGEVMNHVGGVWYADPRTGLFELALIRDDYSVSDLRVFDETNIIAVESYQKPGYGELVNQIVVAWTDVPNNKAATTPPLQDSACIQAQGSVVAEVRQYPGITKADLAQRVALRDLTAASTPLAALRLKVNREAWDLVPGKDVIVVSWAKLGIVQLVCRVLKVDRGTLEDGAITLEVAEDVFGLPDAVYTTQEPQEWTPPVITPDDILIQSVYESPYWDLARNLSAADLDYTDVDSGYVFTLAARNTETETSYNIWSRMGSDDYVERGVGSFAPTALLNGAIDQQATTLNLDSGIDLDEVEIGGRVLIGEGDFAEWGEVLTLNTTTGAMTVNRAVLDTTPQSHADNTRVWFVENAFGIDPTERVLSDEVDVKLTAQATGGESDLDEADEQEIEIRGRFGKPYPPGRIRINGEAFPTEIDTQADPSEGFLVTWAHRDRTQQDVDLIIQNEADIGPEPGTTYTVELYDDNTDELVDSVSVITGTSVQMTATSSFSGRLEVYSVNGGRESWQRQIRRFSIIASDLMVTEEGDRMITEDGDYMTPEN